MSIQTDRSTIGGLSVSQARKIGKRYFGQNLDKVEHKGHVFDIYIYDTVDKKELAKFKENWSEFNIKLVAVSDYNDEPSAKSKTK